MLAEVEVAACTVAFELVAFAVALPYLLIPPSPLAEVTAWTAAFELAALAVEASTYLLILPSPLAEVAAWTAAFELVVFADAASASLLIWLLIRLLKLPSSVVLRPILCMIQG